MSDIYTCIYPSALKTNFDERIIIEFIRIQWVRMCVLENILNSRNDHSCQIVLLIENVVSTYVSFHPESLYWQVTKIVFKLLLSNVSLYD